MFQNGRTLSNWNETIICCHAACSQPLVFSQSAGWPFICNSSCVISLPFTAVPATPEIGHEGGLAFPMNVLMPTGKTPVPPLASLPEMSFHNWMEDLLPDMPAALDAQGNTELPPDRGDVPGSADQEQQHRNAPSQTPKPVWYLSLPLAAGAEREGITRHPEQEKKKESLLQTSCPVAAEVVAERSRPQMEFDAAYALPGRESPVVLSSGPPARKEWDLKEDSPPAQVLDDARPGSAPTIEGTQPPPPSQPLFLAPELPAPVPAPPPDLQATDTKRSSVPALIAPLSTEREQTRPWEAAFTLRLESDTHTGEQAVPRTQESHPAAKEALAGVTKQDAVRAAALPRSERTPDASPVLLTMNERQTGPVRHIPESRETRAADGIQREPDSHPNESSQPKASSQPIKQDFRAAPGTNLKAPATETRSRDTATHDGSQEKSDAQVSPDRRPERPQTKTESVNTAPPGPEKRVRETQKEAPTLAHAATVASRSSLTETRKADDPSGATGETPMAETASPAETQRIAAPARESKQITLPLDSAGMRDIEVRLVDQGGRVQVSVHSPDREIRSTLRANIEELIGSLETRGIRTETATTEPSHSALSDAASTRESRPMGASDLSPATSREFDASRQQQQQQQRNPWLLQTESRKPAPQNADAWQQVLEASWQTPS